MTPGGAVTARAVLARELVHDLLVLLRAAQLYEPGNTALEGAAEKLAASLRELRRVEGAVRLEVGGDLILVNGERVRSELRSRAIHDHLRRIVGERGVGGFEWHADPDVPGSVRLAGVMARADGMAGVEALAAALDEAGVADVTVLPPFEESAAAGGEADEGARARAERTYRHSVAVVRNTMESVRAGGALQR